MRMRAAIIAAVVLAVGLLKAQRPLTTMSPDEVASVAVRAVDASTLARNKYVWRSETEVLVHNAPDFQQTSRATMVDGLEYTLSASRGGHEISPSNLEVSRQSFKQSYAAFLKRFDPDHDAIVGRLPRLLASAFVSTVTGPETVDGDSCVVLRSVPKDEEKLVSVRVWIDAETKRLVRTDILTKNPGFMRTTTNYERISGDDLEVSTISEALNEEGVSGSWKSMTTSTAYAPRPANVVSTLAGDR